MSTAERVKKFWATLHDPEQYVKVENVPVFDEHEETYYVDESGKPCKKDDPGATPLTRKFSKDHLEYIARVNNTRFRRGEVSALTFGHTDPKQKDETKQPPIQGYAAAYSVGKDDDGRHMLQTNYFIKKSAYQEATTYPRTSIELWPGDWAVDPIALLRRTPARPLPQWSYAASEGSQEENLAWQYYRREDGREILRYSRDSAIYVAQSKYERDTAMADLPPMPAEDEEEEVTEEGAPPEMHAKQAAHMATHPKHHEIAAHYAKEAMKGDDEEVEPHPDVHHYMRHAAQGECYAKCMGMKGAQEEAPIQNAAGAPPMAKPSATNALPPGKKKPGEEPSKFAREMENIRFSKLEAEFAEHKKQMAALLAENEDVKKKANEASAEGCVRQLVAEGYHFKDVDKEVKRYMKMSTEERTEAMDWVREHLSAAPVDVPSQYGRGFSGQVPIAQDRRETAGDKIDYVRSPEAMPEADQMQVQAHIESQRIFMPGIGADAEAYNRKFMAVAGKLMPQKYGKYAQAEPALNGAAH